MEVQFNSEREITIKSDFPLTRAHQLQANVLII